MTDPSYELAAILATRDPGELYSGLSVLVSIAADGGRCAALAAFGALDLLTAPDLEERAPEGLRTSLGELRALALELDQLTVWACAASVEIVGIDAVPPLAGVMSTPRFLRETAGARRFIHV